MLAAHDAASAAGAFCPRVARRIRGDRWLVRQIEQLALGLGLMVLHEQCSWSGGTFSGVRHRLLWAFEGDEVRGGEHLTARLEEHDFDVPGHLVAKAEVTDVIYRADPPRLEVRLEILVLDQ